MADHKTARAARPREAGCDPQNIERFGGRLKSEPATWIARAKTHPDYASQVRRRYDETMPHFTRALDGYDTALANYLRDRFEQSELDGPRWRAAPWSKLRPKQRRRLMEKLDEIFAGSALGYWQMEEILYAPLREFEQEQKRPRAIARAFYERRLAREGRK